jgi:hypothetical protein
MAAVGGQQQTINMGPSPVPAGITREQIQQTYNVSLYLRNWTFPKSIAYDVPFGLSHHLKQCRIQRRLDLMFFHFGLKCHRHYRCYIVYRVQYICPC